MYTNAWYLASQAHNLSKKAILVDLGNLDAVVKSNHGAASNNRNIRNTRSIKNKPSQCSTNYCDDVY